jgi:hypothetical protein
MDVLVILWAGINGYGYELWNEINYGINFNGDLYFKMGTETEPNWDSNSDG